MKLTRPLALTLSGMLLVLTMTAQAPEPVNIAAIEKIKAEAARLPQVMDVAGVLVNTHGARLTNSPSARAAGEYVRKKLVEWKLADVRLETFSFGNGWTNDRFSIKVVSEPGLTLLAYPKAWTPGTAGPITAEVVEGVIRTEQDFARLRGKLRGKFVMILPPPSVPPAMLSSTSTIKRFTDAELTAFNAPAAPAPAQRAAGPTPAPATPPATAAAPAPEVEAGFFAWVENALSAAPAQAATPVQPAARPTPLTRVRVTQFYFEEGVAGMIEPGPPRGAGAVLAVTDTGEPNAWKKDTKSSRVPPQIVIAADQYNKLMESIQKSAPVSLEVDIRNTYHTLQQDAFNVVADIKGTDKADEVVVLGAHLDSWHLGKGATDNATGVAVVMEAARLLRTLNLPLRRTVRLGLWTAEEQGLQGSRAFVDKYFVNRPIFQTKPGHAKLSAYFNVDNGTGAIRGVYMQGNESVNPIFEAWMAPLKSLGMTTLASRNAPASSDHISFDSAGLPGFQFIQDPIEYPTRTHHTNVDTFDKLLKDDMVKNAAIVASFVYLAADRDELLPRKPLPRNIRPAGSPVP